MKRAILIILMLCISLTSVNSVYAIPQVIRKAGIVDGDKGFFNHTYSTLNIGKNNGACANELPAEMVYRVNREISEFYIEVSGGSLNDSFEIHSAQDLSEFKNIGETAITGALTADTGNHSVYKFNSFDPTHRYIKIILLDMNVRIKSVVINRPFNAPAVFEGGANGGSGDERVITQEDVDTYRERIRSEMLTRGGVVTPSVLATLKADGS